jgi:hypothetical protein
VGIALRRSTDAPYMRRWKYRLRRQKLSTKNDDTLRVGQQQLQIFVVSRAQRKLSQGARRQLLGKYSSVRGTTKLWLTATSKDWGSQSSRFLNSWRSSPSFVSMDLNSILASALARGSALHAVAARREGWEKVITASYLRISSGTNLQASSQFEGSDARPAFTRSYRWGTSFS